MSEVAPYAATSPSFWPRSVLCCALLQVGASWVVPCWRIDPRSREGRPRILRSMLVFAFTDGNMITVGPKRLRSTEVLLQPGFHWHKSLGFYYLPKELDGTRRVPYSLLGTELTAFTQQQTDCKCRSSGSLRGCSLLVSFDGVVAGIVALLCERPQSGISEQQCCMRRACVRHDRGSRAAVGCPSHLPHLT